MAKRFLTVFGLALLYLASLSLILILVTILLGAHQTALPIVLLAALVLSFAGFVPFLDWVVKRVFTFQGEGQPVPLETLRAQIQTINALDAPVAVRQQNGKLVVSWKHTDPRCMELFAEADFPKTYELHIKFDEARRTVTMLDRANGTLQRPGLGSNPGNGAGKEAVVQGVIMTCEVGKQWGINRSFALGEVHNQKLTPMEIKLPILNSILRSGWDVRYGLW